MIIKELIRQTKKLIAIQSTADNPKGLQEAYDFMVSLIAQSGKDITIEEFQQNGKPSFIAYRGKLRPKKFHILLNGHVDVIGGKPDLFKPYEKDGKLYGRGSYDMKAAAVILADLFCEYVDKTPYTLGLQIVTDEEVGGLDGAYHQIQKGIRADFIVCGECGRTLGSYEIANETKGIIFADIVFTGKTGHGAYPWRANNAALKAAHFVKALHNVYPTPDEEHHNTTATVTALSAGTGMHNTIPDQALVKVDIRFLAGDRHFQDKAAFAKFITSIDPDARVAATHVFSSPMYADPNTALLQDLKKAAESVEGKPFNFVRRHGGSDGRFFTDVGGQACELGIAGHGQHEGDEYITLEAFENYRLTIRTFLDETIESKD